MSGSTQCGRATRSKMARSAVKHDARMPSGFSTRSRTTCSKAWPVSRSMTAPATENAALL